MIRAQSVQTQIANSVGSVSLADFRYASNPLQAAFDRLGVAGGTIRVPEGKWILPSQAQSADKVRNIKIIADGPGSELIFTGLNAGIVLTFDTPDSNDKASQQFVLDGVSVLTRHFADTTTGVNGSGQAVLASWAQAVGDVTQGVTIKDCQFGNENQNADGSGNYAWWDTCIALFNARQVTITSCTFSGPSSVAPNANVGIGLDLQGGTIQTQLSDVSFSDMDTAVWLNGVCEGFQWYAGAAVNCNWKLYGDGAALGRSDTTSTTSATVGTGTKTFAIADVVGPNGLAWTRPVMTLRVMDATAPRTNWMQGNVVSYDNDAQTVTIAVTSTAGSGTFANWLISPRHYLSDVKVGMVHGSCVLGQVYARWMSNLAYFDNFDQKREGSGQNYVDIDLAQETTFTHIHDCLFQQSGVGGTTDGICIRSQYGGFDARNFNVNIHDIWVTQRDRAVVIENGPAHIAVNRVRAPGSVTTLIDNQAAYDRFVTIDSCLDNTWPGIYKDFADGDTTPSVASNGRPFFRTFNTTGPTSITYLDDMPFGQIVWLLVNDNNTTFIHSVNMLMKNGRDFKASSGTVMAFVQSGGILREVNRHVNNGIAYELGYATGGLSTDIYWKKNGTEWYARLGDDSGTANIRGGDIRADGNVQAAQGGALGWFGRTLGFAQTDGTTRWTNNAATAGCTIDWTIDAQVSFLNRSRTAGAAYRITPMGTPGTPAASGEAVLYVDLADSNKLKVKHSTGTVTTLSTP